MRYLLIPLMSILCVLLFLSYAFAETQQETNARFPKAADYSLDCESNRPNADGTHDFLTLIVRPSAMSVLKTNSKGEQSDLPILTYQVNVHYGPNAYGHNEAVYYVLRLVVRGADGKERSIINRGTDIIYMGENFSWTCIFPR